MIEGNFVLILIVILFASALAYRTTFLQKKSIGYFSLLQILYMVVIPGFLFPMVFSYLRSVTVRPLSEYRIVGDGVLLNMILLSILFAYGGVTVHSVTKMLGSRMKPEGEAFEMNRFFHMNFSHNLIYSAVLIAIVGLSLLELNQFLRLASHHIKRSYFL